MYLLSTHQRGPIVAIQRRMSSDRRAWHPNLRGEFAAEASEEVIHYPHGFVAVVLQDIRKNY